MQATETRADRCGAKGWPRLAAGPVPRLRNSRARSVPEESLGRPMHPMAWACWRRDPHRSRASTLGMPESVDAQSELAWPPGAALNELAVQRRRVDGAACGW